MSPDVHVRGFRRSGTGQPFLSLLSIQLKLDFGVRSLADKLGFGKKGRSVYLYLGLLAMAFIPMMGLMYSMAKSITGQAMLIGQPGLPAVLIIMSGQFMVLFVGISGIMSSLYYSQDLELLQAMPFTPRQIMMAKVLPAYVGQILLSLLFTGPFLAAFGYRISSFIPEFWPYAVLVYAAIPGIPLALSILFVVVLMRLTKGSKKRDSFRVLFGLVFFALLIAFQLFSTSVAQYGPQYIMEAIMEQNGLIQLMSRYYPLLSWGASALTGETFAVRGSSLLIFVGISIGAVLFAVNLTQRWFLGGVSREVQGSEPRGKVRSVHKGLGPQVSSTTAVLLKDHRILTRTPNFLLVVLTNLSVVPLILLISMFAGDTDTEVLLSLLKNPYMQEMIPLFLVAIHGFVVALNQVASTGLSREGTSFWMSKLIPVRPKDQVKSKLIYSMLFSVVQLAILMVTMGYFLKLSLYQLAVILVLGLLAAWPVSVIALSNDIYSPRLNWTNPQAAMKGNFMTVVAGLLGAAYLAIVGFAVNLAYRAGISAIGIYGLAGAILLVSGFLLTGFLYRLAEARYPLIDV
jgi:ABC-2 type transport system permease protein